MEMISVLAVSENNVLGDSSEKSLWSLPDDLELFKTITKGGTLLMGRKTHEAIGRVLPGRRNVVLSRQPDYRSKGCEVFTSFEEAVLSMQGNVFVIGGAEIYELTKNLVNKIYLTRIHKNIIGDIKFSYNLRDWVVESKTTVDNCNIPHTFFVYLPKT